VTEKLILIVVFALIIVLAYVLVIKPTADAIGCEIEVPVFAQRLLSLLIKGAQ